MLVGHSDYLVAIGPSAYASGWAAFNFLFYPFPSPSRAHARDLVISTYSLFCRRSEPPYAASTMTEKPPVAMRFMLNGMSFANASMDVSFITFFITWSRCARDL